MNTFKERNNALDKIRSMLKHSAGKLNEYDSSDHAAHLYALWSMGQLLELKKALAHHNIENEFWDGIDHLPMRINEHFIAPNLGEWAELPNNLAEEFGLLPGDIIVIKQQQQTLWEWQHAGMIKDEHSLYSAMYTKTVLEQPIDYYRTYAVRVRVLRVKANHENPELGKAACCKAQSRLGNIYGVSDKWYAIQHEDAPMYCSQLPWYAWATTAGINLDCTCPDYPETKDPQLLLKKWSALPYSIVFPTNLAESCNDYPNHGFTAKTECVLDMSRKEHEI